MRKKRLEWRITDKGDPWALRLVDGRRVSPRILERINHEVRLKNPNAPLVKALDMSEHYSRRQAGTNAFTRNGQNLVFMSEDKLAVWCTFRPAPGVASRPDGRSVWECAMFRNAQQIRRQLGRPTGRFLSSNLIKEAVALTWALWRPPPEGGIITFVKPECLTPETGDVPGACYIAAGWGEDKPSADGKLCFSAPKLDVIPDWRIWPWVEARWGKLRKSLAPEQTDEQRKTS